MEVKIEAIWNEKNVFLYFVSLNYRESYLPCSCQWFIEEDMFIGKYEKGIKREKIWNEKEERILEFKARHYKKFQNTFYPNKSSKGKGPFSKTDLLSFRNEYTLKTVEAARYDS